MPSVCELLAITMGSDHRGGDLRTNAFEGAQSSTGLIGRKFPLDFLIVSLDALIQYTQGFEQFGKPGAKAIRQTVFAIFQDHRNPTTHLADPVPHHNPVLAEQPRIWLASAVRCFTTDWRIRCKPCMFCCSTVLTVTKRMFARPAASQMPSASL